MIMHTHESLYNTMLSLFYFSLVLKTTQNYSLANHVLAPAAMKHEDPTREINFSKESFDQWVLCYCPNSDRKCYIQPPEQNQRKCVVLAATQ